VKQGADKRRITENAEILALFQASGAYRPEEDAIRGTSISDLEIVYLKEYFKKVYGREIEEFDQPLDSMLRSLSILSANGEVTRAGMLFFGKHPDLYERSFMVKAVAFAGNSIGDTSYIDSRDISGTIPWMFRESMTFLKSVLRHQQNGQNFNSVGILEIPEVVLEELVQNALVHIDLLHEAAIRILVFNDRIEIINPGCLYGGLQVEDIKLGVSRQRNPLMASLAAKTMIYRGLGSGIIRVMKEGACVDFVNEESANQFRTIVWRTIQKGETTIQKEKSTTQKRETTTQKENSTTQKRESTTQKDLTTTQKAVLDYFKNHPKGNRVDAALAIGGITEDGVKFIIGRLQQLGLLKREGGRRNGTWVVMDE
jgi:predicted HTH transcriptional regulator